jgi:hypothetical protein
MVWRDKVWHGLKADYSKKWFHIEKGGVIVCNSTGKVVDILK